MRCCKVRIPYILDIAEKDFIATFKFLKGYAHESEDYAVAYSIVDKHKELGVIVCDIEGYQYSYDWYMRQNQVEGGPCHH